MTSDVCPRCGGWKDKRSKLCQRCFTQNVKNNSAQRFWDNVQIKEPGDCWEWMAGKFPQGYGSFKTGKRSEGAHRIAYRLTFGPIPQGRCVCHRCDNPSCCNPAHLFVGTSADNARDMVRKGRAVNNRGAHNGRAKLTAKQVLSIRQQYGTGIRAYQLAKMYGVSRSAIVLIVTRRTWAWL